MTNDKFKVEVVGDLTEKEARAFVYGTAVGATVAAIVLDPARTWPGIVNNPSEPSAVPPGAEEQWSVIYMSGAAAMLRCHRIAAKYNYFGEHSACVQAY